MAQFNVYGFDGLISKLNRLGKTEEIAPKMLERGMAVLQPAVVEEASKHRDTGAMVESIKSTKVTRTVDGYYICTRPTGKDERGIRNMEKMAWLEFGVKGRAAVPVITAAVIRKEAEVVGAMRQIFEQEVRGQ